MARKKEKPKLTRKEKLQYVLDDKYGKPRQTNLTKNCSNCAWFTRCNDPASSPFYRCSLYSSNKQALILPPSQSNLILPERNVLLDSLESGEHVMDVDDRDSPLAKNFFDWMTNPVFNTGQKPFPKQLQIALNLFGEICPYCSDMAYANNIPVNEGWDAEEERMVSYDKILERVQLLENGVCPKCKSQRKDMYANGDLPYYNELAGCAGQRGSKSLTISFIESYNIHRWIKLRHHFSSYNLAPNTTLLSNYVALNLKQAEENLWDPLYSFIEQSVWYRNYFRLLDSEGKKRGQELYIYNKTGIKWKHAHLSIYPTIPEEGKLRGRTRFGGWIDEISRFPISTEDHKMRVDANDVHDALSRSLLTLRAPHRKLVKKHNDVPGPLSGSISSPFAKRDKMMQLYEESQQEGSEILGFHFATWEMSPKYPRNSLEAEFKRNYETAMRDYGAVPPNSGSPFLSKIDTIKECVVKTQSNLGSLNVKTAKTASGELMLTGNYNLTKSIADTTNRIMAIDAGSSNNSFAIVIGHNEVESETIDGTTKDYNIPTFDFIGELTPHSGLKLNHSLIYKDVISPLIKATNCKLIVADRWQSMKLLSDAEEDHKIKSETYSLKYSDFVTFRDDILDCGMYFPKPEMDIEAIEKVQNYPQYFDNSPISHLFYQMLTVQDILGKTVTKGPGTTDDIFRALVLAHSFLIDPDYSKNLSGLTSLASNNGLGIALTTKSGANSTNTLTTSVGALSKKLRGY